MTSERADFVWAQCAVLAGQQRRVQLQGAHVFAVQAYYLVVKEAEHPFDLVIAAFDDAQASAVLAEYRQVCRLRGEVFKGEVEAFTKLFDVVLVDDVLGFDVVDLGEFGLWLGQAPGPPACC